VSITRVGYGPCPQPSIHSPRLPASRCRLATYSYELPAPAGCAPRCGGPFDEAVATLAEMTGVVVPKRSAEQVVIDAATDFEAFLPQS